MTEREAIAKAQKRLQRTGRPQLVTKRTAHPAYPGEVVYLTIPEAEKHSWATDETLVTTLVPATIDERYEYAVVLHKLVMAYDAADWDGHEPYPGLSGEAWSLLHRDYGGAPLPAYER